MSLSPVLLRNYLRAPHSPFAQIPLGRWPEGDFQRDFLHLLRGAFSWILWTGPVDWTPPALELLDKADLLLWVSRFDPASGQALRACREHLAEAHLPEALCKTVLNRVPENFREEDFLQTWGETEKPVTSLPEDASLGPRFSAGIERLVRCLTSSHDLFLPRPEAPRNVEAWRDQVAPRVLQTLQQAPGETAASSKDVARAVQTCVARESGLPPEREARQQVCEKILQDLMGLGPLEPFLGDPNVTEIMVQGTTPFWIEKEGRLFQTSAAFPSIDALRTVIDRMVCAVGRRIDEQSPLCDTRWRDGSRINIVLPPLAIEGPTVTIRKFMPRPFLLGDWVSQGGLSEPMALFLRQAVLSRRNLLVSGGTGSGKTTLLNALSGEIPRDERVITLEDAAELQLQQPHVVRLESRPPNAEGQGAVSLRRLLINALRMRPDRLVIGECRGPEALDMLQAMNTGHDGSMTTLHANSARDALRRLEALVLMAGVDWPVSVIREHIHSAIHLIVHLQRSMEGRRRVVSITEVTGLEGEVITLQELFRFRAGQFEASGLGSCS